MSKPSLLLTIITLAVFLTSCFSAQFETQTAVPIISMTTTSTLVLTDTPSFVSTHTSVPSATPHPLEPTFPPGPTLTAEESQSEIARLMQGDSSCLFPCWWGIVPGKTSRSFVVAAMAHLNLKLSPFELPEGIEYGSPFVKYEDFIQAEIGFTVVDDTVEDIHVRGSSGSDPAFANRWAHYGLTEILKIYGPPSRFWAVLIDGGEVGKTRNSYHLLVFYDEKKTLVRYSGSSASDAICPDFNEEEIERVDMYLQTPDKSRKLTDITSVSGMIELLDQPDVYWVEKMSKTRIDELYALFTQGNESKCFNIISN